MSTTTAPRATGAALGTARDLALLVASPLAAAGSGRFGLDHLIRRRRTR
jgi:hypothetical protein